jgi:O-antigen/teichoic acid export membrane protein
MQESHKGIVLRNIFWNFFSSLFITGISIFTTPYILKKMGDTAYGIYGILYVVIGYFGFLQMGLGTASVKYIAEYAGLNKKEEISSVFGTSFISNLIMGLIGAFLLCLFTPVIISKFLKIPLEVQPLAKKVFFIGAIGFVLNMVISVPNAVITGFQRLDIANKIGIFRGTMERLIAVFILFIGFGLFGVIIGNLFVGVITFFILWKISRNFMLQKELKFDKKVFLNLFTFGGYVTISGIVSPILTDIEKVLIGYFLSVSVIPYYLIPYNLIMHLGIIPGAVTRALFPAISSWSARDKKRASSDIIKSIKYQMAILLPLVTFLFVLTPEFLRVWIGKDFSIKATNPMRILIIATVINFIAHPPFVFLQATGKPQIPAIFHLLELPLHIFLCVYFIKRWQIDGAALAWLLRVMIDTSLLLFAFKKESRLVSKELLLSFINLSAIISVLMGFGLYLIKTHLSLPFTIIYILLSGFFYSLFIWNSILTKEEREIMKENIFSLFSIRNFL